MIQEQRIISKEANAKLQFSGKDAPNGVVIVNGQRLYELINQGTSSNGLLEIDISEPDLEAYAFTFG